MPDALIWPGALSLLLAWGAVSDVKWRKLPNWLAALLLALGLAFAATHGGLETMGWHAAHAAIALVAGMALFAAGLFGGGDAKFYAGMAAYFPLSAGFNLLLYVAIAGGILALGWIVGRRMLGGKFAEPKGAYAKLPYGVAIAAGGLSLVWMTPITS